MKVSVEKLEQLERKITVEIPGEKIDEEVAKQLKELAQDKTFKLKGYRAGKAKPQDIERVHGKSIRGRAAANMMEESFIEAIKQESLDVVGYPHIHEEQNKKGSPFIYTATFEIYPEIKIPSFSKIKVEKQVAELTDSDLEKIIDRLREQHKDWQLVDREAQLGDQTIIDFLGKIDGEAFPGGEGKGYPLELGAGRFIPGFEEGLVGVKTGEKRTVSVTFPEDYHEKKYAGKPAEFDVTVHEIKAPTLAELNDAFAEKLGVKDVAALRDQLYKTMNNELKQALNNNLRGQVMDQLNDLSKVDVPNVLVDQEIERQQADAKKRFNLPDTMGDLPREHFEESARKQVTVGLLVSEIIKENKLAVTDEDVKEKLKDIAVPYEDPEAVVQWYYEDEKRLSDVKSMALESKLIDLILSDAKVKEVMKTYDDVMNPKETKQEEK